MTTLHQEYHTISRQLYPTTEQKLQLAAQFDLQDHAFNEWADLANSGVSQGKSYETIQREIEAHLIPTDRREDRYALSTTRSHVLALLVRLTAGKIEKIQPRLPDRRQRSFTYETVGISEYHLALPSLGTIAMTHSSPLPPNETLCYAKVFVDDFGNGYHVDLVTVSTMLAEVPYIYEAAESTLLVMQGNAKLTSLKSLQAEQQRLIDEQQRFYDKLSKLKFN